MPGMEVVMEGGDREAASSLDNRKFPRVPLEIEVDFSSEHNFYNGFVENISAGGIFIATYDHEPLGKQVTLKFKLPDEGRPIEVQCEVRWIRTYNQDTPDTSPGMGLRFNTVAPDDLQRIEEFVRAREPMFFDDE